MIINQLWFSSPILWGDSFPCCQIILTENSESEKDRGTVQATKEYFRAPLFHSPPL